ncbi:hypothetical protein [Hydrotalea sp.]|uniref:HYC_CC_PP family protein n=1 Tax=Hydrotalea sp. TaxID=2881279 RepID=UPI0026238E54|nr:hypothetical protein [Hydrotalea sp.]
MKRFAAAILTVLYISTSVGAMVHMHCCMGKLAELGLGQKESKTCGNCGMKTSEAKEKGCCRDEHKFIKNNTDQKATEAGLQLSKLRATDLRTAFIESPSFNFTSISEDYPESNAPPRSNGVAAFILNRTFLI